MRAFILLVAFAILGMLPTVITTPNVDLSRRKISRALTTCKGLQMIGTTLLQGSCTKDAGGSMQSRQNLNACLEVLNGNLICNSRQVPFLYYVSTMTDTFSLVRIEPWIAKIWSSLTVTPLLEVAKMALEGRFPTRWTWVRLITPNNVVHTNHTDNAATCFGNLSVTWHLPCNQIILTFHVVMAR